MSTESLQAALAAEDAAIFGYDVVGTHLTGGQRDQARAAETAHRDRRDALLVQLAGASPDPSASSVADPAVFSLPFPVTDAASALKLAVTLEEGTARAWRRALDDSTGDQRTLAVTSLIAVAEWATRWRKLAGVTPLAPAFPGDA